MKVFVQARMSSSRLPKKILKPVLGKPILQNTIVRCAEAVGTENVVVLTSTQNDDDAVEALCADLKTHCFRGSLTNVYDRFSQAAVFFNAAAFVRISADSPLIDPGLIKAAVDYFHSNSVDLVTNVYPRSFPKGQSVEVVDTRSFQSETFRKSDGFSQEHVTQSFYESPKEFSLINFHCEPGVNHGLEAWAVDTQADYDSILNWTNRTEISTVRFPIAGYEIFAKGSKIA